MPTLTQLRPSLADLPHDEALLLILERRESRFVSKAVPKEIDLEALAEGLPEDWLPTLLEAYNELYDNL